MDWQPFLTIGSIVISMLTALSAVIISHKVYRRQKSFENENHFFKYKMEQYQIIIQHATDLHNLYLDAFLDIKEELKETLINE